MHRSKQSLVPLATLAKELMRKGRHREALPLWQQVVRESEEMSSGTVQHYVWCEQLATCLQRTGQCGTALEIFEKVLSGLESLLDPGDTRLCHVVKGLAFCLIQHGSQVRGLRYIERATLDAGKMYGWSSNTALCLSVALMRTWSELSLYSEIAKHGEMILTDSHLCRLDTPSTVSRLFAILESTADAHRSLGDHQRAAELLQAAVRLGTLRYGSRSGLVEKIKNRLARQLEKLGRAGEALSIMDDLVSNGTYPNQVRRLKHLETSLASMRVRINRCEEKTPGLNSIPST